MTKVIFGLDLSQMQWCKRMNNIILGTTYEDLFRARFIVVPLLAVVFCCTSAVFSFATRWDYLAQHHVARSIDPAARVYNSDYTIAAAYNIFSGAFVIFVVLGVYPFELWCWLTRRRNRGIDVACKACAVISVMVCSTSAIALTIVTASCEGYIDGVNTERARELSSILTGISPHGCALIYRHNSDAVTALCFLWLGWIFTTYGCIGMSLSIDIAEAGFGHPTGHARDGAPQAAQAPLDYESCIELDDLDKGTFDHPEAPKPAARQPLTPGAAWCTTPDQQRLRHSRVSGLVPASISPRDRYSHHTPAQASEASDLSDFSALASGGRNAGRGRRYDFYDGNGESKKSSSESRRSGTMTRTLGEMSLAKLTSGVSDGGFGTR